MMKWIKNISDNAEPIIVGCVALVFLAISVGIIGLLLKGLFTLLAD